MSRLKNKEEIILKAAEKLFYLKGYSHTSIQDIATEACIGKGTVYEYFKSKEALVVRAVEIFGACRVSQIKSKVAMKDNFFDKLNEFVDTVHHLLSDNYPGAEYMIFDAVSALNKEQKIKLKQTFMKTQAEFKGVLAEVLNKGMRENIIKKVDVEFTSDILAEMTMAFCRRVVFNQYACEKIAEDKAKLFSIVMDGIRKQETVSG